MPLLASLRLEIVVLSDYTYLFLFLNIIGVWSRGEVFVLRS